MSRQSREGGHRGQGQVWEDAFVSQVENPALAGAAQWNECPPSKQTVAGSIPSQGTCLGCWLSPQ